MSFQAVLLIAILAVPLPALAQATDYTYTGQDFSSVDGTFTKTDKVTGGLIVSSPLGDNLSSAFITPTSFSFSDGLNTIDNSDTRLAVFDVSTNSTGQITDWYIELFGANDEILTASSGSSILEFDNGFSGVTLGANMGAPGIWKSTSVPEFPSPVYLVLAAVAISLGLVVRRRFPQTTC
jgi:hypothetical protein